MPANDSWLSVHLFYNEPWESFLTKVVDPYIQTVLKTGIAQSYFFVRYWEKGPHIRLRFRGKADELNEVLKPNLLEYFEAYMQTNPSERVEPDYPEDFPRAYYWYPNNSIRFESYDPEIERYGGIKGMSLAEEQFHLSSNTVLHQLKLRNHQEDYSEKLGDAIRLHLGFLHSIGLDNKLAISFLEMIFENWLPHTIELPETLRQKDYLLEKMNEFINVFEDAFEEQKEALIEFHQQMITGLKSGETFESEIYNHWIKENRRLSLLLYELSDQGQIPQRKEAYILSDIRAKNLNPEQIKLWNIWADYIHMTNNRLGILNRDEAYLAFLMKRSMEALDY